LLQVVIEGFDQIYVDRDDWMEVLRILHNNAFALDRELLPECYGRLSEHSAECSSRAAKGASFLKKMHFMDSKFKKSVSVELTRHVRKTKRISLGM
jgi:hypothetical protein